MQADNLFSRGCLIIINHTTDKQPKPKRIKMNQLKKTRLFLCMFIVLCLVVSCGAKATKDPKLEQAAQVVREMLAKRNLERSMFSAAFKNPRPSQFVSYMFSDMGVAEWPPSEVHASEMQREQMSSIRATMTPKGVTYIPLSKRKGAGKQLVVKSDDGKGVVIIVAYSDPTKPPIFTRELKFIPVRPAPVIVQMFRANAQSGISYQAF